MFEKVCALIADQLKIDPKTIKPESRLLEDQTSASGIPMMLLLQVLPALGTIPPDDALMRLKTVGDVVKYLESKQ